MAIAPLAVLVMLGALLLSAALVPVSKAAARRFGVLDSPGHRKVHTAPMPRMGGLAVFLSFTAVVLTGYVLAPRLGGLPWLERHFGTAFALLQEAHKVADRLAGLVLGSAIAFTVGLADDVLAHRFPAWAKALGQTAAALVLVVAGVKTSFLPFEWMNVAVTLLWVVGVTNAFNLLDNMDGLSAGVAFVASGVLLINAAFLGELFICLILVAFMGSLLGFLIYNFNPASIFLGDCGSLFIGYVIGSLTLLERYVSHASSTLFPVLMPVLVLAVPLVDTATVVVIRIRERRPIYVGDSRHLSHRLVSLGLSQRMAVLVIYLITFCLGLGAISLPFAGLAQSLLILLQGLGIVTLVLILLFFERRRQPRAREEEAA